jgi:pilus assembly protein Flp/PilA
MGNFVRFIKDETGATAIEYGLIAAAMGIAIVVGIPVITTAWKALTVKLGTNMK